MVSDGGRSRFEIRREGDRERIVGPGGEDLPPDVAQAVADLRRARDDEFSAVERQRLIAQRLISAGASWTVVGWCLGITRGAASRRYGRDRLP